MPAIGHIMLALVYLTACAFGGVALYQQTQLGVSPEFAAIIAGGSALALLQIHSLLSRQGASGAFEDRFKKLKDEIRKLSARVTATEEQAGDIREYVDRELAERRTALVSEMRSLEDIIGRLSRNFDNRLQDVRQGTGDHTIDGGAALEAVRDALRENRVDLHLQPIVNLPQRRVCFYEGFTRLRRADGKLIMPSEFLAAAERANLLGAIDNMLLFRCVQIVRRLSERDRRIGVFCNVALTSLEDENFFPSFLDFMRENRDLAGSMIFEFGVKAFAHRSEVATRNMAKLRDLGFRYSLDKGDGLALDLQDLQSAGVRFVKVNGDRLLEELTPGGERPISAITRDISPEDVPAVFTRYGIDLIAEKVESEKSVIELLEFDIPFGQGHVFGAPRPIKGSLQAETAPPPEFIRRASANAM
jgi:cyclic-di-GMP phosphodiesterase TipF (flagellum assembly factor)